LYYDYLQGGKKLENHLNSLEFENKIGFVPTMGAIHKGHISLIEKAKSENKIVVSSIFVNPTQFNDQKDFINYPKTIENDILLLTKAGCDVLFLPTVETMYPLGIEVLEHFELGYLDTILEGKHRPGHFQGVCNIVFRLLSIIKPQKLYLGKKDYQQCLVIKEMISLKNLQVSTIICETVREIDGLAMSSRNLRLSKDARIKSSNLYKMLQFCKDSLCQGEIECQLSFPIEQLKLNDFSFDYFEIVNANSLKPITYWDGKEPIMIIVAVFLDGIRLIDNLVF
jgi:pantoate--beta-alanine ligase